MAVGGVAVAPGRLGIEPAKRWWTARGSTKSEGMALRFLGPKSLKQFTKIWMPVGKRVVMMGGAVQGCRLTEFLVKRGKQVTIVEEAEKLGEGLFSEDPVRLFAWFKEKGVRMMAGVAYEKISMRGWWSRQKRVKRETIEADSILTALPLLPNQELLRRWRESRKRSTW